jgi:hypothetical protein
VGRWSLRWVQRRKHGLTPRRLRFGRRGPRPAPSI